MVINIKQMKYETFREIVCVRACTICTVFNNISSVIIEIPIYTSVSFQVQKVQ